ncbi:MAG TPA: hypothetical protein PLM71_02055 [Syntrophorhabdaceae bacterium]|nr:hypothetical protein [Syntrophorhabdaceae bacterium]
MAKVTRPLMSIDASGAFVDTIVYAKWKWIKYSRQYAISVNPRTDNQLQIRDYFTIAVMAWQAENQATKDAWNQAASGKPLSGFNNTRLTLYQENLSRLSIFMRSFWFFLAQKNIGNSNKRCAK